MEQSLDIEYTKEVALNILREAGKIALDGYGKGNQSVKFDDELVTSFEAKIEDFIRTSLQRHFPGHSFFEYSVSSEYRHDTAKDMWVFDALDGVANYQAGIPMWGMSIALVENLWPIFGAYYMPSTGDLFWALADGKAYCNGEEIKIVETEPTNNESLLFTYSRFHEHFKTTFPGKIRNLGCTGAHICYVAKGRAEGAVIHNVAFKDLLAPSIILRSAGGDIEFFDRKPFHINDYIDGSKIKKFILVAPRGYHDQLRNYLERTKMV